MPLEPQRYKYYKTQLSDLLQSATALIRTYYDALSCQAPQLNVQANRIWELSQRQRLVSGINEAAAATLLSACHDAYRPIYQFIDQQQKTVAEVAIVVADFERECQALTAELGPAVELKRCTLTEWSSWLAQALSVLQTQTKFLQLDSRSLLPTLVQSSAIKQFTQDLELTTHYKAKIVLGLAEALRRPELLPLSLAT
ncbi:uncharacterized protein [Drosophila virilis]|uniref:Uncharacterized protein n=1 Tax=Drosophila virilis TaxID=7244 RepID=B4M222_DROVI|nr:uncharacterized protein LOC6632211 [Drosophila virilis]EDW65726.1 uncharacterized protein Dvir_GJ18743 [Drosophila virilis]